MSEINDIPAFPLQGNESYESQDGMTLRDYFAARAMQGLLSDWENPFPTEDIPRLAYKIADGMLIVRAEDE
jgi:hypothetical protein